MKKCSFKISRLRNLAVRYLSVITLNLVLWLPVSLRAATGSWTSTATGGSISFTVTESSAPLKDFSGNVLTVVYLENLGFTKIGGNSNATDVVWLLSQGYRVIELDYAKHANAITPAINADIIAINDALAAGSFCGYSNCSKYKSYVLFEGYRIQRNVPYFKDDPTVYNYITQYTDGDTLHMDVVYPANASVKVPVVLSFSYSNSYATYDGSLLKLTDANRDQRLNLGNTLAGFDDSFLEGLPANGIAWAIADHPKYCNWGSGKPINGANKTYASYETNPDAAQKVKSAVRSLRVLGGELGLSGKIGIYGFSRGSTAGSLAIGDRSVSSFENAGVNIGIPDDVQVAALGSGVFDFTQIFNTAESDIGTLRTNCPLAWGALASNYALWQSQGAAYLAQSTGTAPVMFFYNTDDAAYYQDQISHFKAKLDSLGVPTATLINYGTGHAVPQTGATLSNLYSFFQLHFSAPCQPGQARLSNFNYGNLSFMVTIDPGMNSSSSTLYAIRVQGTSTKYVQANGGLDTNPVYQTLSSWSTPVVGPIENAVSTTVTILAKNTSSESIFSMSSAVSVFLTLTESPIPICMISRDLKTESRIVVWERKSGSGIKACKVYRKAKEASHYALLGTVPYNDKSLFVDSVEVSEQQQYQYAISVLDSSGNESGMSKYHSPIILNYSGATNSINLSWSTYEVENSSLQFRSYVIYKGRDSTKLNLVDTVAFGTNEFVDTDSMAMKVRMFYRVAGVKDVACIPTGIIQTELEQYTNSYSNLENNRLFSTQSSGANTSKDTTVLVTKPDSTGVAINTDTVKVVTTTDSTKIGTNAKLVGFDADLQNLSLVLSPIPATNKLTLKFSLAQAAIAQIEMCNLSGILIYKAKKQCCAGLQLETISLSELKLLQGIYYVKVNAMGKQDIRKFVKE